MTTTTKALYRTVDVLALKLVPDQACSVTRNQEPHEKHVYILRPGRLEPEGIREEDLMVYGGVPCSK